MDTHYVSSLSQSLLGWLTTFSAHSTLLIAAVYLISRRFAWSDKSLDVLWRVAVLIPLLTTTLQTHYKSNWLTIRWVVPPTPGVQISAPTANGYISLRADAFFSEVLIALWLIAMLIALIRFFYFEWHWWRIGRTAETLTLPNTTLPSHVELRLVNWLPSPVALGHRLICLPPQALTLPQPQLHALLAHERAHLRRFDTYWLAIHGLIEAIFVFQPLLRIARREWQASAEMLCDAHALRETNDPIALAQCMATVARWLTQPVKTPIAGMAGSPLKQRVQRILDTDRNVDARRRRWAFGVLLFLFALVLQFMPRTVVSIQSADEATPAPAEIVVTESAPPTTAPHLLPELPSRNVSVDVTTASSSRTLRQTSTSPTENR